ncbi:MAG: hypothetical protein H6619_01715 [Deltaproteobacteria bacterium]|nr:hypothetical protein [Deltaproteobacteria bacterium]
MYKLALAVFFIPSVLLADGEVEVYDTYKDPEPVVQHRSTDTQGSVADYDKRLPPVVPGEQLVRNGRKVKVWSTSGPVPVSPAPRPFDTGNQEAQELLKNGGVIVDTRGK